MEKVKVSDLKIGDAFQFGRIHDEPIVWLVGEHGHKGFPEKTTAVITKGTIGNITFAPANPLDKVRERRFWGSNRYRDSYVRKYINHPETLHDESTNMLFSEEELAVIAETCIQTRIPEIDGGEIDICLNKLFLLSASEVGFEEENAEGSVIELFKNRDFRKARDIDEDLDWWWLRSAVVSNSFSVRNVHATGSANNLTYAYFGSWGLRPACNLLSDYLVSVVGGEE